MLQSTNIEGIDLKEVTIYIFCLLAVEFVFYSFEIADIRMYNAHIVIFT